MIIFPTTRFLEIFDLPKNQPSRHRSLFLFQKKITRSLVVKKIIRGVLKENFSLLSDLPKRSISGRNRILTGSAHLLSMYSLVGAV